MTGTPRPRAVVFDVNEALTDLVPVARAFTRLGLGPDRVPWWFAVLFRDGMALAAAGGAARFADLARDALAAGRPVRIGPPRSTRRAARTPARRDGGHPTGAGRAPGRASAARGHAGGT
ncbi:MAG: hypothetical protein ACYCST_19965 [Acidimicrobiales bacterium]